MCARYVPLPTFVKSMGYRQRSAIQLSELGNRFPRSIVRTRSARARVLRVDSRSLTHLQVEEEVTNVRASDQRGRSITSPSSFAVYAERATWSTTVVIAGRRHSSRRSGAFGSMSRPACSHTATANRSPMAAQYLRSVESFTSAPASSLMTTDADIPMRAATTSARATRKRATLSARRRGSLHAFALVVAADVVIARGASATPCRSVLVLRAAETVSDAALELGARARRVVCVGIGSGRERGAVDDVERLRDAHREVRAIHACAEAVCGALARILALRARLHTGRARGGRLRPGRSLLRRGRLARSGLGPRGGSRRCLLRRAAVDFGVPASVAALVSDVDDEHPPSETTLASTMHAITPTTSFMAFPLLRWMDLPGRARRRRTRKVSCTGAHGRADAFL
jgi:hypothetical protein